MTCAWERDSMWAEVRRRFDAMRYALRFGPVSCKSRASVAGTVDAQLELNLTNHSGEFMRFEVEDVSAAIRGTPAADASMESREAVIPPHSAIVFACPPVCGLPPGWQGEGFLRLTARYGHASSPPQFRVRWECVLQSCRPPGRNIEVVAYPQRAIEVEDI